jgi:hypothetical protein
MRDDDEAMHQTLKGTWNGIGREKEKDLRVTEPRLTK